HDTDCAARVQRLDDAAGQLAMVGVDDRDRQLAQDLVEIRLWGIDAVDQRRTNQQDEGAADRKHTLPFAGKRAGDTGSSGAAPPARSAGSTGSAATGRRPKRCATARSRQSASST